MRKVTRTLPWILAGLVALAWGYHDLVGSYFLRDDFMWLFDSESQLARPIEFLTTRPSGYFRPFANLFFGLEHVAFGLDPRGYFVVNVLLHGWNALWLGALVLAFGGSARFAGAAGLLAVSLTSAGPGVVWISGLVSLLAVAMILPCLFFYHAALEDGRPLDYVLALVCLILAVCSRESGVLAGLGIVVLELVHGRGLAVLASRGFWRRMAPFAVAGAAYCYLQLDFLTGGGAARSSPGSPLAFVHNAIVSLPALMRPEEWRRGFSFGGGLAILAGLTVILGAFRGKRGLLLALALFGLLLFAFLPTYPILSNGYVMANRYRYEASFVAALMLGAAFDALFAGPQLMRPIAWLGIRRTLAAVSLIIFTTAQLEALPRFVDTDERFAAYADATRLLNQDLDEHFGPALAAGTTPGVGRRVALVGVPVENLRHLRCALGVLYGFDFERVQEVRFDLEDPSVVRKLSVQGAAFVREETGSDEVWVWTPAGLVRGKRPLAAMRKDWRRPGRVAKTGHVEVLSLPDVEAGP